MTKDSTGGYEVKIIDCEFDRRLSEHDWLQIEQAAAGCIDGTSDEWPALRVAIEKITGNPFRYRKSASWLQGFCEGVMIQSGRSR